MIAGIFHEGSGLGDQLFRYITVRTLAEEKGYEWGMDAPHNFKGQSFMHLDFGEEPDFAYTSYKTWDEKDIRDAQGNDIRSYDPEINFVEDNTVIDGSFEDSKYWGHNLDNINKWLEVENMLGADIFCPVGFRGGEYALSPELFLPREYFEEGMETIKRLNSDIIFDVQTDDPTLAQSFFIDSKFKPHITQNEAISHSKHTNMGFNWRMARFAKYAVIPNSAFFILPRLLKHHEDPTAVTIAPRGWSRRNIARGKNAGDFIWGRPSCFYPQFRYI